MRDSKGRFISTKAIAETVASVGAAKAAESTSIVGKSATYKGLSARQAYENNVHARKAITARATQIGKAKVRLFSRRSGEEITSGECYDFANRWITQNTNYELSCWYNTEGEIATWKGAGVSYGRAPAFVRVLDPAQLIAIPYGVRNLADVTAWAYTDGQTVPGYAFRPQLEFPSDEVMYAKNWNPNSQVRGLSNAVTGVNEISTHYYAGRYNAAYFQNGAQSSIVVRFPKGTNPDVAREWVAKWESQHSIYNGYSFKVAAVIGEEMQIEEPGMTNKEGQFLELREKDAEDIYALWGVPASEAGMYSRTRHDTIADEREMFFENTILPELTMLSSFWQTQLIDPHFPSAARTDKRSVKLFKHASKEFDRRRNGTQSDILIMLDPDSLPIAARLRERQLETMDKHRRVTASSFGYSAEWAGMDREDNEATDLVYVASDQTLIPSQMPKPEPAVDSTVADEVKALRQKIAELTTPAEVVVDAEVMERFKAFYRAYRGHVLSSVADQGRYDKVGVLKLLGEHELDTQYMRYAVAVDHLAINTILRDVTDAEARLRAIKDRFNAASRPAALKQLAFDGGK